MVTAQEKLQVALSIILRETASYALLANGWDMAQESDYDDYEATIVEILEGVFGS